MSQSKQAKAREHMRGIGRNYPDGCTTFGACQNKCGNSGRGSGLCANCYEDLLAEQCGARLAKEYHQKAKSKVFTISRIEDYIEAKE